MSSQFVLSRRLACLEDHEQLLLVRNRTDNLEMILATMPRQETDAQAKLGVLIHLQRLLEHAMKARIELAEMDSSNHGRKAVLEAAVKEWEDNLPVFRQQYERVSKWISDWENERDRKAFKSSEDYRTIVYGGRSIKLTPNQALIVRILHAAKTSGNPFVPKEDIQQEMGASASDPRDSFRKHENRDLWGSLIKTDSKGAYWLDLSHQPT